MKLAQGYVFTGMCDSVQRGRICITACWDTPPLSRHPQRRPPGADTPQTRHPPQSRHPPGTRPSGPDTPSGADTPWSRYPSGPDSPQTRYPLGPDPPAEHAGRYGQPAGSTHPTGMQSYLHKI